MNKLITATLLTSILFFSACTKPDNDDPKIVIKDPVTVITVNFSNLKNHEISFENSEEVVSKHILFCADGTFRDLFAEQIIGKGTYVINGSLIDFDDNNSDDLWQISQNDSKFDANGTFNMTYFNTNNTVVSTMKSINDRTIDSLTDTYHCKK